MFPTFVFYIYNCSCPAKTGLDKKMQFLRERSVSDTLNKNAGFFW